MARKARKDTTPDEEAIALSQIKSSAVQIDEFDDTPELGGESFDDTDPFDPDLAELNDPDVVTLGEPPLLGNSRTTSDLYGSEAETVGRVSSPRLYAQAAQFPTALQFRVWRWENGIPVALGPIDAKCTEDDFVRKFYSAMPKPGDGKFQFGFRPIDIRGNELGKEFSKNISEHHATLKQMRAQKKREEEERMQGPGPWGRGPGGDVIVQGSSGGDVMAEEMGRMAESMMEAAEEQNKELRESMERERDLRRQEEKVRAEERISLAERSANVVQVMTEKMMASDRSRADEAMQGQQQNSQLMLSTLTSVFQQQQDAARQQADRTREADSARLNQDREFFERQRQEMELRRQREREEAEAKRKEEAESYERKRQAESSEHERRRAEERERLDLEAKRIEGQRTFELEQMRQEASRREQEAERRRASERAEAERRREKDKEDAEARLLQDRALMERQTQEADRRMERDRMEMDRQREIAKAERVAQQIEAEERRRQDIQDWERKQEEVKAERESRDRIEREERSRQDKLMHERLEREKREWETKRDQERQDWERRESARREEAQRQEALRREELVRDETRRREEAERIDAKRREETQLQMKAMEMQAEKDRQHAERMMEMSRLEREGQREAQLQREKMEREDREQRERDRQRQHDMALKELESNKERDREHQERMLQLTKIQNSGGLSNIGEALGMETGEILGKIFGGGENDSGWSDTAAKVIGALAEVGKTVMKQPNTPGKRPATGDSRMVPVQTPEGVKLIPSHLLPSMLPPVAPSRLPVPIAAPVQPDVDEMILPDQPMLPPDVGRPEEEKQIASFEIPGVTRVEAPIEIGPLTEYGQGKAVDVMTRATENGLSMVQQKKARKALRSLADLVAKTEEDEWLGVITEAIAKEINIFHYIKAVTVYAAFAEAGAPEELADRVVTSMRDSGLIPDDVPYGEKDYIRIKKQEEVSPVPDSDGGAA